MSRAARAKKLDKVWSDLTQNGFVWTREEVALALGIRVEDVQRKIDEAGPSAVLEVDRWQYNPNHRHCCYRKRRYEGQLPLPPRRDPNYGNES